MPSKECIPPYHLADTLYRVDFLLYNYAFTWYTGSTGGTSRLGTLFKSPAVAPSFHIRAGACNLGIPLLSFPYT